MLRTALSFALLCCLASPAFAGHRSQFVVTVDKPIVVIVDGKMLEAQEGSYALTMTDPGPGRHRVEFRNFVGKLVGQGEFDFPLSGDAIVRARWAGERFSVYEIVPLEPEVVVVAQPQPVGGVVVAGPGGAVVVGGTVGGAVVTGGVVGGTVAVGGVTTTTTTVHTGGVVGGAIVTGGVVLPTGVVVVEQRPPQTVVVEQRPAPAQSRSVTFRSTDGEWASVYVDGKKIWEVRVGTTERAITLPTGDHTIEVKDFMENTTWCKGRLFVSGYTDLVIGISEGGPFEVYNDGAAFSGCQ